MKTGLGCPFRLLGKTCPLPVPMRTGAEAHQVHALLSHVFKAIWKQGGCETRSCICRAEGGLHVLERWSQDGQGSQAAASPWTGPHHLSLLSLILHRLSPKAPPCGLSSPALHPYVIIYMLLSMLRRAVRCAANPGLLTKSLLAFVHTSGKEVQVIQ